jgi:hypothetical protein
MKTLILGLCILAAALFAWTWNPVWFVPLVSGMIALGAHWLRTRLEASARLTDPDYDRKLKEGQFRFVLPGLGVLALALALHFLMAEGWNWSLFWPLAFGLSCIWISRWGLRRVKRQSPLASS